MSLSTTCSLFWTDVNDNVVEVDHDDAVCDSTYTTCKITGSHGGTLQATCDSKQHYPDALSSYYTMYFCVCNGNSVSVPAGVTCSPSCYDLTTPFPTCSLVWLYDGFTSGSASNFVKQDTCQAFLCDSHGTMCTDSSKTLLYQCDNTDHDSQVADDSNDSYVCNCHGAAQIPEIYRGAGGKSLGTGCAGSTDDAGSQSSATAQATAIGANAGSFQSSTTAGSSLTTTTSAASSTSSSGSRGMASWKLMSSKGLVLSMCSSVLLRLLCL